MDRRDFLRSGACVAGAAGVAGLIGCTRPGSRAGAPLPAAAPPQAPAGPAAAAPTPADAGALSGKVGKNRAFATAPGPAAAGVATKRPPAELVAAALEAIGGIGLFVQKGDRVVIKPNLAWGRDPAGAANTQPEVLAAVIKLAKDAGAGEVLVVEHTCDSSAITFEMTGAQAVCQAAGVKLISLDNASLYREETVARGAAIKSEHLPLDILDCDCYINLPCLKHHSATNMTLALKNQMGATLEPGRYHRENSQAAGGLGLHQNIADLATALRPTLVIADAVFVLTNNGPKGPGDVTRMDTVIATHDMVLADALGAQLMGFSNDQVPYIGMAAKLGLGSADVSAASIARV